MKIKENIRIIDLSLYLEKEKTLIIGDIHLGYEESLNKQGFLIPRFQFQDMEKRIKKILNQVEVEKVIINGDLKHEFGSISFNEWNQISKFLNLLKDKEIIFVYGNHDKILIGPLQRKKKIKILEKYNINNITIIHGDKILKDLKKTIIMGHEHPAISFSQRPNEKYKCFLKGKYKNQDLIVMPSFFSLHAGTDIKKEKLLSPYLQKNLNNFEVYIIEDKPYFFGKLKHIN